MILMYLLLELSLEDGAATLTQFTGSIIGQTLNSHFAKRK